MSPFAVFSVKDETPLYDEKVWLSSRFFHKTVNAFMFMTWAKSVKNTIYKWHIIWDWLVARFPNCQTCNCGMKQFSNSCSCSSYCLHMCWSITDLQGKCSYKSSFLLSLVSCLQNFIRRPRTAPSCRLLASMEADLCSRASVFVQAVITGNLGEDLGLWSQVPVCASRRAENWGASLHFCF